MKILPKITLIVALLIPSLAFATTTIPWITTNNATITPNTINGISPVISLPSTATSTFSGGLVAKCVSEDGTACLHNYWQDVSNVLFPTMNPSTFAVNVDSAVVFGGATTYTDGLFDIEPMTGGFNFGDFNDTGNDTFISGSDALQTIGMNARLGYRFSGGTSDFDGWIGVATGTPGSDISAGTGANFFNISATATSTLSKGINIKTGCFSINNICVGAGTVTSVATNNGLTGGTITSSGTIGLDISGLSTNALTSWNGSKLIATGTPQLTVGNIVSTTTANSSFVGSVGVGTTSPFAFLSVSGNNTKDVVDIATTTNGISNVMQIDKTGMITYGTSGITQEAARYTTTNGSAYYGDIGTFFDPSNGPYVGIVGSNIDLTLKTTGRSSWQASGGGRDSGVTINTQSPFNFSGGSNLLPIASTFQASGGLSTGIAMTNTWNTSGTAGDADIYINRTESTLGSGSHYLLKADTANIDKFTVSDIGTAYISNRLGIGSTSPIAATVITTAASSTPNLIIDDTSNGGCIIMRDAGIGRGYTELYTVAGVLLSKVTTSITTCN